MLWERFRKKMTDLNTNQYLYKQPYLQNQPTYGDGKGGFPTSIDDKRLDSVKDNLKTGNPVGKVVGGVTASDKKSKWDMPITLALGSVFTLGINKLLSILSQGETYKSTLLEKYTEKIDNFSRKAAEKFPVLKFDRIKNAYHKLPDTNFIKQIIGAPSEKAVWSMAQQQSMPFKNMAVKDMLNEAIEIAKQDPKIVKKLTEDLHSEVEGACEQAYKKAVELAGKNPSAKFSMLKNNADSLINMGSHTPLSRFLIRAHKDADQMFNMGISSFKKNGMGAKGMMLGMFLMNAYFLGKTFKDTLDAPKGEKISTLAHGLIVDFIAGWMLMIPAQQFMYKAIGSLKNLTGKGLTGAIKAPFRGLGKLLSIGLNMPEAKTGFGKVFNGIKGFGGGIGRFALVMMVLFPLINKIGGFISHSIFGKPNALLAKEKAEAESGKTENTETLNNTDALKQALEQHKAGMLTVAAKNQQNTFGSINPMIEKHLKAKEAASVVKPEPTQEIPAKQQYVPSDTSKIQHENIEKKAKFDATLAKTDSVIADAQKALGSV